MEPNAPSDAAADPAYDIALALAEAAGAHDLAVAAAEGDDGAVLLDTLLTHELAIGHSLMARLAAGADGFIRRIGQAPEGEADRAVIEAARLTGVVARMMERYRLGFMTLARVRAMPNGAKQKMIVRLAWGDGTWDTSPDRSGGDSGDGNGGTGGGGSGGAPPPPPAGVAPPPAPAKRPPGFGPGLPPLPTARSRAGCLRNGNPSGDFAAAPRCGARTRAGDPCRQPAMANGRCRLHGGKSTGPRSAVGLAAARASRLRHGAYAANLVALRSEAARCGARLDRLTAALRGGVLAGQGVHPTNRPAPPEAGPPDGAPVESDECCPANASTPRPQAGRTRNSQALCDPREARQVAAGARLAPVRGRSTAATDLGRAQAVPWPAPGASSAVGRASAQPNSAVNSADSWIGRSSYGRPRRRRDEAALGEPRLPGNGGIMWQMA